MSHTPHRLEVYPVATPQIPDTRGRVLRDTLARHWPVERVRVVDVYTIDRALDDTQCQQAMESLSNPVAQRPWQAGSATPDWLPEFTVAIEVGFLPGVTDNEGHTARQIVEDALDTTFEEGEAVYSSKLYLLQGELSDADVEAIAGEIANPLIQRVHVKRADRYRAEQGMEIVAPRVHLHGSGQVTEVPLDISDAALAEIGRKGVPNGDGTWRGPLGLALDYMQAIQAYFAKEGRAPRDIELETLAQTWSEHCKHTIFADPIDDVAAGIYRHYIKRATQDVRKAKGKGDFCVSVFTDNSGAITFDENWLVTDKAETHNSPCALDPFGGAITGIVGVNRDTLGFGKGAKPVLNRYGYCFADPASSPGLMRDREGKRPMISPHLIMEGVVDGVNVGGNCSGIPTPQGFAFFDPRYSGKPLVFVGTVGLIPREINGQPSHEKGARPGDAIVVIGGRVGKDGIHGATFSSVALDEGSPATAVQIGDPITQKKVVDVILREAQPQGLYSAITDNGAGGLSSSIGEMGEGAGGFDVELDKVPLKYPGLEPWEIWISESQERMTLAVPQEKVAAFLDLMRRRDVEASVVGSFTDSGRAVIRWHGEPVLDLSMEFLHDGLPKRQLKTSAVPVPHHEMFGPKESDLPVVLADGHAPEEALTALLGSLNLCSKEFIATQYDHEVQAGSVLKPLQGPGRVFADAAAIRPVADSPRAVVTSQGILPRYSDIDTYHMAAASIDTAIRQNVAAGGNPDHMALMDNFCWCSSDEPERLAQLKRAAEACYQMAVAFGAPFISGKDSMFNDFRGFDASGNPVTVSVPPTLLISSLSVTPDLHKTISLDAKAPGDAVYLIGDTHAELGASEYQWLRGRIGSDVPQVDAAAALARYRAYYQAVQSGWVRSAISVGQGGLGIALARTSIGGQLGLEVSLDALASNGLDVATLLFSESQSRLLVTVAPKHLAAFEATMQPHGLYRLGSVTDTPSLAIRGVMNAALDGLEQAYKATLAAY